MQKNIATKYSVFNINAFELVEVNYADYGNT